MTMFLLDMHAPGVEIRPLRPMTGGAAFNEVFLTEVRIPDSHRLGEVDGGWGVSLTTLMNERMAIGGGEARGFQRGIDRLVHLVRHLGLDGDPVVRQRLADHYVHARATLQCSQRAAGTMQAGRTPGPELSIGKLAGSLNGQRLTRLVTEVLGPRLTADTGEWGTYAWADLVLGYPGGRIAGGSDEIMRNILGERVLGLPKEPAPSN
jgi:alkylation response protein AidB-like acyl-CoA dehydrogenase